MFKESFFGSMESVANSPYGVWILFAMAFAESSFFPIPPDVLLIPLSLSSPKLAIFFSTICTFSSVLGGLLGYFIGEKGGKPILKKFVKQERIDLVSSYYKKYGVWAIGVAAVTPIPYKVFTISSGTFSLNKKKFIIASIIGRGARFYTVGIMIYIFGSAIKNFLDKYFELAIIVFTVLLIGGFLFFGKLTKKNLKTN